MTDDPIARLTTGGTANLFDLLRTLRTRRVGFGYRVDSGTEEQHPVTGRTMSQPAGPRAFVSEREPLALSIEEEALIAWAGLGPNGFVAWEAPLGAGFDQFMRVLGRTGPEPNNTLATDLVVINDEGAWLYRPEPTADELDALRTGDRTLADLALHWYRTGRTKLRDGRPDVDWVMREPGAPDAMLNGSHQYNMNRPGSTWLLPVTDAGRLQSGLPDLFARRRHYLVDGDAGDAVIPCLRERVESGYLQRPMTMVAYEQGALLGSAIPAGAIVQNMRLACEALGLGAWPLSGYDADLLLGGRPDSAEGIGLGRHGREGVKQATCLPSPWYADGSAIVAQWRTEREQVGGWAEPGAMQSGAFTPFTPEVASGLAAHAEAAPPDWAWDAAAEYIDYCVERFGRWPVTYPPLIAGFSVIVHHLDYDFYDRYHRPGYVTERHRSHVDEWH